LLSHLRVDRAQSLPILPLQDTDKLSKSVEAVEISSPAEPEFKLAIETVSFHTIVLVLSRIETKSEFSLPAAILAKLNTALGY
jgi:hypothetical protein